jgi:hypothetical protein
MALLDSPSVDNCLSQNSQTPGDLIPVDSAKVVEWLRLVPQAAKGTVKPSIDPVSEYFARALDCPRQLLGISPRSGRAVSLDSTCKL